MQYRSISFCHRFFLTPNVFCRIERPGRLLVNVELLIECLRQRAANCRPKGVPETFAEVQNVFQDPDWRHLGLTSDCEEQYFRCVVGEVGHMVAVFMSDRMIKWYAKRLKYGSVSIMVDSTFWVSPRRPAGLSQVYRIVAVEYTKVSSSAHTREVRMASK